MKTESRCSHCGAKIVEYRHSINAGMAKSLIQLYKNGGTSAFKDLNLTFNQKNNFQKLRYWFLIEKTKKSIWSLTPKGQKFVEGKQSICKTVITYRGNSLRFEGLEISIFDILNDLEYWRKDDYIKHSILLNQGG